MPTHDDSPVQQKRVKCDMCRNLVVIPANQAQGKCPSCGNMIYLDPPGASQDSKEMVGEENRKPLEFGNLISKIFELIFNNILGFLIIAAIVALPLQIIKSIVGFSMLDLFLRDGILGLIGPILFIIGLELIFGTLAQGALVIFAASRYLGRPQTVKNSFTLAFQRIVKLGAANIFFSFAIFLFISLGVGIGVALVHFAGIPGILGVLLESILFIYIAIRLSFTYCLFGTSILLEEADIMDSFEKSKYLSEGNLMEMCGIFFVMSLASGTISSMVASPLGYNSIVSGIFVDIISKVIMTATIVSIFLNLKAKKGDPYISNLDVDEKNSLNPVAIGGTCLLIAVLGVVAMTISLPKIPPAKKMELLQKKIMKLFNLAPKKIYRAETSEPYTMQRFQKEFRYLRTKTYTCGKITRTVKEYLHLKTGMEFVLVPGGKFMMGGKSKDEKPVSEVTLLPYLISKTEVTEKVWRKIMGSAPINIYTRGKNPAVSPVTWLDCQRFCKKVGVRLPTEAQWEYACRAGSPYAYCYGDDPKELIKYAWFKKDGTGEIRTVATKKTKCVWSI